MSTILFNGKTYNSVEEMPANERQAFEQVSKMFVDENGNGIPDFLEGDLVQNVLAAHSTKTQISVNGKTFHTLEDLPPDLRQSVDTAFQLLAKSGVLSAEPAVKQTPPISQEVTQSKPFLSQQTASAIEEEPARNIFSLVLGGIVLCFAVVSATIAILYFAGR